MIKVNVGFLVAYDYEMLKISIPLVYPYAHKIVLGVDENLVSWSGNSFDVDPAFFEWIDEFDVDHKIQIYRDNFYIPENTAMQNETRERNLIANEMGEGLCVQLDADEFFVDFGGFVNYIQKNEKKLTSKKQIQLCGYMIDVYKQVEGGYLFVDEVTPFYLASNSPNYVRGRKNKNQKKWYVPFLTVHFTWARSEEELRFKINNWGHNKDFDREAFFSLWKSVTASNYKNFEQGFHPFNKKWWKSLIFIKGGSIQEVLSQKEFPALIDRKKRFFKNLAQDFKFLMKKNS